MFQIAVPAPFVGEPFETLFRAFLSRGIMAIALYRTPDAADAGFPLQYVSTLPQRTTVLQVGTRDCPRHHRTHHTHPAFCSLFS
jgi:hypothetical protein